MNAFPVLINGQPGDSIDVSDRGLHYGDGLFETILTFQGRLIFFDRHLARLQQGGARLGIPFPEIRDLYDEAIGVQAATEGIVKILLTRGSGGRGYQVPVKPAPNRVISWHPLPQNMTVVRRGIRLQLCQTPLSIQPMLAGIKHCNRLEQILASRELDDSDVDEGLMLDTEGFVVEGIRTNVFFGKAGVLYTPLLDRCGVAGVAKGWITEQARKAGIVVREQRIRLEALRRADEVFMTNSIYGVMPVVKFHVGASVTEWPIGTLALSFLALWEDAVKSGLA